MGTWDDGFTWFCVCVCQNPCVRALRRFCEFGRAMVARNLSESLRPVRYFGYILNEFETNMGDIRSKVYEAWDKSSTAPPRTRASREAAEQTQAPSLDLLAWANGAPLFPAALVTRFQEGTPEHAKMQELKDDFNKKFPQSLHPPSSAASGSGRAGGHCDFSINLGEEPLDFQRIIDLPQTPVANFTVLRPGVGSRLCVSKHVSIVLISAFDGLPLLPAVVFQNNLVHPRQESWMWCIRKEACDPHRRDLWCLGWQFDRC